jgi:hypothetical protein
MKVLFGDDKQQLRRLEGSLSALRARPAADQVRLSYLIAALEAEKATVLSSGSRRRSVGAS